MNKIRNLKTDIVWRLILTTSVAILAVGLLSFSYLTKKTSESIRTHNELLVKAVTGEVRGLLMDPYIRLQELMILLSSHVYNNEEAKDFLNATVKNGNYFEAIYILDREGTVKNVGLPESLSAKQDDFEGMDFSGQKYFKDTIAKGATVWSDVALSPITGRISLTVSIPYKKDILAGSFSIQHLYERTSQLQEGREIITAILDNRGVLIYHPDKSLVEQHLNMKNLPIVNMALPEETVTSIYKFKGVDYMGSVSIIPETGWIVLLSQPLSSAYAPVVKTKYIFFSGMLVAILIVAYLALLASRSLMRPLAQFMETAGAIAGGDYNAPVPVQAHKEIEDLAKSFRDMASAIQLRENEIKKSEERYRMLVETMNDGIVVVDSNCIITYVNPRLTRMLGYANNEMPGSNIKDFFDVPNSRILEDQLTRRRRGEAGEYEIEWIKKEGSMIPTMMSAVPLFDEAGSSNGSFAVITEMTERKKLERQLLQAQKMEAIGQLAGGVAHDFNNILTAIINYAHILKLRLKDDEGSTGTIDKITSLSDRATNLTRGLLTFSRRQYFEFVPKNLNDIVMNLENLLSQFVREDIKLRTKLFPEDLIIIADKTQIEQVIINLVTNARDAMHGRGEILIETDLVEVDESFISAQGFGSPGMYAVLSVSDTGMGMNEKTKTRIYDPFFSTKEIGKGTGLGLAIVYGIIKQHNGHITLYSEPGRGTTFKIYFPKTSSAVVEEQEAEFPVLTGHGETILVAEDEETVRDSMKNILEAFGYNVIIAEDGNEAVEQFKRNAEKVRLLILDVVMPGLNGEEAFDTIHSINPEIRAIFTSGYTADIIRGQKIMSENAVFISKPVVPDKLLMKIKEVLETA